MTTPFLSRPLSILLLCNNCVRMIVGEYKQRVDHYKRYDVVGNGLDTVLETTGVIYRAN